MTLVILAYHYLGNLPGDTVDLDQATADGLVNSWRATYATGGAQPTAPVYDAAGRELAAYSLAATLTGATGITLIGNPASSTDTAKDVASPMAIAPVIGRRPVMVEAQIGWLAGIAGTFVAKLYDLTAGVVLDSDTRGGTVAFTSAPKFRLRARGNPAPGPRTYGIKFAGPATSLQINGADNAVQTFLTVTER